MKKWMGLMLVGVLITLPWDKRMKAYSDRDRAEQ